MIGIQVGFMHTGKMWYFLLMRQSPRLWSCRGWWLRFQTESRWVLMSNQLANHLLFFPVISKALHAHCITGNPLSCITEWPRQEKALHSSSERPLSLRTSFKVSLIQKLCLRCSQSMPSAFRIKSRRSKNSQSLEIVESRDLCLAWEMLQFEISYETQSISFLMTRPIPPWALPP